MIQAFVIVLVFRISSANQLPCVLIHTGNTQEGSGLPVTHAASAIRNSQIVCPHKNPKVGAAKSGSQAKQ